MSFRIDYSENVSLSYPEGYRFKFTFPRPPGRINMITKGAPAFAALPEFVRMSFKIVSTKPVYSALGGGTPSCRFYIQRKGDDFSAMGDYQYYRWWSNPVHYDLGTSKDEADSVTITAPLMSPQWTSVLGAPCGDHFDFFKKAWLDADRVGLTFGGNYFGHGVQLESGKADFYLIKYKFKKAA